MDNALLQFAYALFTRVAAPYGLVELSVTTKSLTGADRLRGDPRTDGVAFFVSRFCMLGFCYCLVILRFSGFISPCKWGVCLVDPTRGRLTVLGPLCHDRPIQRLDRAMDYTRRNYGIRAGVPIRVVLKEERSGVLVVLLGVNGPKDGVLFCLIVRGGSHAYRSVIALPFLFDSVLLR